MNASASSRGTPDFCASPPVFTSISNDGRRPSFAIAALIASASRGRSSVSITSAIRTASRALLVCSPPIKCNDAPGSGNFSAASCTRFSPNTVCPAAKAARTASTGLVFDTATSVTSSGFRPARSAALAIRSRT